MNARLAAKRLTHLSMRYAGALVDLVCPNPPRLILQGHPGLRETRDFINLILITRAEINALTKVLIEKGITTPDRLAEVMADEYEWLTKEKARFLNVGVSDEGLVLFGMGQSQ